MLCSFFRDLVVRHCLLHEQMVEVRMYLCLECVQIIECDQIIAFVAHEGSGI